MNPILFMLMCFGPSLFEGEATQVVIIAHPGVPVDSLSSQELHDIFLGKQDRWREGQSIFPIVLTSGPTHDAFLTTHLNKTATLFHTLWMHTIFTGQGRSPKATDREDIVVAFIAATPGAIGYVNAKFASKDVKVIFINQARE